MKTSIILEKPELSETWEINVCSTAKYNKNQGYISVEFTDSIMPYLAQVRKKFVLYNLKEISNFGSLYTTRLYELLQEFQETGWMIKSIEQLREIFAVGDKFNLYSNFKRRTFEHACEEINANYNIGLSFEELKENKRVVAIKFFFQKTKVVSRTDQQGNIRNEYVKPALKSKLPKKSRIKLSNKKNEVLDGQLTFKESILENKIEDITEHKSIGSILTPLFQKLMPKKK